VQSNSDDAAFGTLPSRLSLKADQEGESASISLGTSNSRWGGLFKTNYALKATVPFSKASKRGDFLTETGLPDAYSLEASMALRLFGRGVNDQLDTFLNDNGPKIADATRLVRAECARKKLLADAPETIKKSDCKGDIRVIAGMLGMSDKLDPIFSQIEDIFLDQQYLALQLTGGVGRQAFDHRDPASLAEIEDDRTVYNASASFVYLPKLRSSVSYIAGVEFERDFELPDEEIRCPAGQAPGPTVTCFNASFGPPALDESTTIFAGLRFVGGKEGLGIGGELRAALDPDSGEWGVEAPIYFIRSSENQLNAGIRFAYDSERDDATVGLFVGRNFGGLLGE
jgi:hypothetical protein